jgi:hypothetical protein
LKKIIQPVAVAAAGFFNIYAARALTRRAGRASFRHR